MRRTVDGFPIRKSINFLPTKPDPKLNRWSYGKTIKIPVADFFFNPRWVRWKEEMVWVADYELFAMIIGSWIRGNSREGRESMTKEQALDLAFEMSHFGGSPPRKVKVS